jgi:hypothetical protein
MVAVTPLLHEIIPHGWSRIEEFVRSNIATTASLPCSETTVTFTLPFWI